MMKRYLALTAATFVVGVAAVSWMKNARVHFGFAEQVGDSLTWRGELPRGGFVWIRNLNGSITVEPAEGNTVEVVTEKRWRHSDPKAVRVEVQSQTDGITMCAVWPGRDATCQPGGGYKATGARGNDVRVRFIVRVPAGAKVDVSITRGDIEVSGAFVSVLANGVNSDIDVSEVRGPVEAHTTNGDVSVETASGPVQATTVSGDVSAIIHALTQPGDVVLRSVNGDVEAELPPNLNAEIAAGTVNGRVETEYPVTMTGRINPKSLHVTIGRGGRKIELQTMNGDIQLTQIQDDRR